MAQNSRLTVSILLLATLIASAEAATKKPAPSAPVAATSAQGDVVAALVAKRNYKGAFTLLLAMAQAGDAKAMVNLGNAYHLGLGTARDDAAAKTWYEKAAAAGDKTAETILAKLHVAVPPTIKKNADASAKSDTNGLVDLAHLPQRTADQPDWTVLAAAQKNYVALKALTGGDKAQAQLVSARLGDVEALGLTSSNNGTDGLGRDALSLAMESGSPAAVDAVIAQKPDFSRADKNGLSAVARAAVACDADTLGKISKSGGSLEAPVPALLLVAQHCTALTSFNQLFEKSNFNVSDAAGRSAAWFGAQRGDEALLGWLADHGADLNKADSQGLTPLHIAAAFGQEVALQFILSKAALPNVADLHGVTPLMLAAAKGCAGCVKALLDSKATLDLKDAGGDTALMYAVRGLQGKIAQNLAESGANPNAKNNSGDTPTKLGERLGMMTAKIAN